MTQPIKVEDYDPHWPQRFEALRARISQALGPLAKAIEHIGSTAVPGLSAKPIIDIDVLLQSGEDLHNAINALTRLGYKHRGDLGVAGREAFKPPAHVFPHHLYVCPPDSEEFQRHLAFRDHLRAHPGTAQAYADLKRKLAAEFACDGDAYTNGKTQFVKRIRTAC